MKPSLCLLTVFSLLFGLAQSAQADTVLDRFSAGKREAWHQLSTLCSNSLRPVLEVATERWVLQNQGALLEDLRDTPEQWFTDVDHPCVETQAASKSQLSLYHPACAKEAPDLSRAAWLYLEATLFHLNFSHPEANRIGYALLNAQTALCSLN